MDRDFPAAPALVTLKRDGREIDAVAQTTKQGWIYVFDRTNGKPLFPVEYHPYPAQRRPRGGRGGNAAVAHETRALCTPAIDRGPAHESNPGDASVGR